MAITLPIGSLTVASIALTSIVVGNAYYQKKQFYPSVVYITKSNPSLAAIYFIAFTIALLFGKFLKKIFFGQLRAAEFEQLLERTFYAVTETCIAFTVFRDDFSPKFVLLFMVLLFLKAFHYLTDSRVDFMERSPVITMLFHTRVASLLLLLMVLDLLLLTHSYLSTMAHGASVQLVFGFEYAILFTVAFNVCVKYVCHTIDLRSENPWENKAVYLLYTELVVGFIKVLLNIAFVGLMIKIHTFPLFVIRPMYFTARAFKRALMDVVQSRRAIRNMNTLYPDATEADLSAVDAVCIICRDEMTTAAKKLPCGHIFHASCLRSWFQRQQTCPTCRMDILQTTTPPPQPQRQAQAQAAAPATQPPQTQDQPAPNAAVNQQPNPFAGLPHFPFAQLPLPPHFPPFAPNAAASGSTSAAPGPSTSSSTSSGAPKLGFATGSIPPFLPFLPFLPSMPSLPADLSGFSDEQLLAMEGRERTHIEVRLRAMSDVRALLDAAALQMSQFGALMTRIETIEGNEASANEASASAHASDFKDEKKDTSEKENDLQTSISQATPPEEDDEASQLRRRRLERFSPSAASTAEPTTKSTEPNSLSNTD